MKSVRAIMRRAAHETLVRRIAVIDPLADAGIGGYTHELASALQRARCDVEVFAPTPAFAAALPRSYVLRAAICGPDFDPAGAEQPSTAVPDRPPSERPVLEPYLTRLMARPRAAIAPTSSVSATATPTPPASSGGTPSTSTDASALPPLSLQRRRAARQLAATLRAMHFDTIWTQWPILPPALADLVRCGPYDGLSLVHTVHNVTPHEANPAESARLGAQYAAAHALVTHSAQATRMLASLLPAVASRIIESRHGTYSIYPRRPAMRAPVRALLGVADTDHVLLSFGAVRPYKNTDALIAATALLRDTNVVLVIAGWEYGFAEHVPGEKLGRTRAMVAAAGVSDRVRLLPGPFGIEHTAELFEASDVVMLPYRESSGSGVLCMALTYDRDVICTPVGGMGEYLTHARHATVLTSDDPASIAAAIRASQLRAERTPSRAAASCSPDPALHWDTIAPRLLSQLRSRTPCRAAGGR